jgi:hypothetical protein
MSTTLSPLTLDECRNRNKKLVVALLEIPYIYSPRKAENLCEVYNQEGLAQSAKNHNCCNCSTHDNKYSYARVFQGVTIELLCLFVTLGLPWPVQHCTR